MRRACVARAYVVIFYTTINVNYAQYKPLCMRYAVTYCHDTFCFETILHRRSRGRFAVLIMAAKYVCGIYRSYFITTISDISVVYY